MFLNILQRMILWVSDIDILEPNSHFASGVSTLLWITLFAVALVILVVAGVIFVFSSILNRMILGELLKVFVISLVGITGLLLMGGIVAEATQQGLGPAQILAVIPLLIPSTLPYTLPTTTLFATCVVYGRLAHDNEILAIKAAGVNVTKVMVPCILLGLAMSAVTMTLYYRIIPHTHGVMRTMFIKDVEELLYAMLTRRQDCSSAAALCHLSSGRAWPKTHRYMVPSWPERCPLGRECSCPRGRIARRHGQPSGDSPYAHVEVTGDGELSGFFADREWAVPLPDDLNKDYPRKPRDLSWQELFDTRKTLVNYLGQYREMLAKERQSPPRLPAADDLAKHFKDLQYLCDYFASEIRYVNAELLLRPDSLFWLPLLRSCRLSGRNLAQPQ